MTGEIHVTDPASIAARGTYAASMSLRIASEWEAESRGLLVLARQADPAWVLAGVAIDLELISKLEGVTPEGDLDITAGVLALEVHDLVSVVGMPAGSPMTSATLWVEGWTETIAWGAWRVSFAVSDYCRNAAISRWDDVADPITWDTAEDVTWDDVTCVPPVLADDAWNAAPASARWDTTNPTITWDTAEALWPS